MKAQQHLEQWVYCHFVVDKGGFAQAQKRSIKVALRSVNRAKLQEQLGLSFLNQLKAKSEADRGGEVLLRFTVAI